ncbi:RHS repeat-associated core domain-containing protein, partial [Kluyvera intermedia]|uniref:RHS repeat-associated core domain-containing protein n=1 Tax=Kluyvera intermedia TaxID=61648 RepID=UPI003BA12DC5
GWDGDRLVTTQTQAVRIQTVYQPGSFTPLLRIETETAALAKTQRRSLAEKLQQDAGIAFPAELVTLLNGLETELKRGVISERNQQWLNQCGLNPEQLKGLVEPECEPERKIHLYHCDHRGLPLALINREGNAVWRAEYDEWGNQQMEDNPENLQQLIRLPGQQYDQETGLYYNRYRYYDAMQRRYITQDPIGLAGGLNPYIYPLTPTAEIDPEGLWAFIIPLVEWTMSEAILYFGSTAAAGAVLATSGDSEQSKRNSLVKCEEKKPCPPCNPPVGEKFNIVVHYEAHPGRGLADGSHGCFEKTGSPVHWHFDVNNQNPKTCECIPRRHQTGGCGMPSI